MLSQMSAYSTNSPNPYAKRYSTKSRRSLDNTAYLEPWPNSKRIKKELQPTVHIEQDSLNNNSETYNFLTEDNYIQNDFHQLYDTALEFDRNQESSVENYIYLNDNQNVVDENNVFIEGSNEEYSIDFIDEADNFDGIGYNLYPDQTLYNTCFLESQYVSQPSKSKRKQGIVGRPTLSSPQRLLVPDNVYSRGNPCLVETENYFTDNNYRNRQPTLVTVSKNLNFPVKKSIKHESMDHEDSVQRNGSRSRPRILSKPTLPECRQTINSHFYFNATEQDALEMAQRTVANREFARNLVKRAERQGTVIDKNKIPLSVFEQQPVEVLMKSALHEHRSGIAEIKESEQMSTQPFLTTVSVSEPRKAPIVIKKPVTPASFAPPKPPPMTASDILKQKWKAASRQQS